MNKTFQQNDKMLHDDVTQSMWVVFSGESEISWVRWMFRRGFRHCYAIINDGTKWVTFDPLAHKSEVAVHHQLPSEFDLPEWLKARGLRVLKVGVPTFKEKPMPPALFTCVEAMKRLIGVRKMRIFTPYQLYKELAV